jgi:ABC-2 type transport system permease protein
MSNLRQAIYVELLKARRSRMPWVTLLAFSLAPLAGGFFMFVLQDPERARSLGFINAKAQILAGTADWPTYLGLLAQAVAVGGGMLFSLIGAWVFGREFSDHTIKDLLALPTRRTTIVVAKFMVILLWSAVLTVIICLIGLVVGAALGLPLASQEAFEHGTATILIVAALTVALVPVITFAASAGRGYLPAVGVALLAVVLAQLIAAAGWGEFFPWSVPALRAGVAAPVYQELHPSGYLIVLITGLVGVAATIAWWERADQTD